MAREQVMLVDRTGLEWFYDWRKGHSVIGRRCQCGAEAEFVTSPYRITTGEEVGPRLLCRDHAISAKMAHLLTLTDLDGNRMIMRTLGDLERAPEETNDG